MKPAHPTVYFQASAFLTTTLKPSAISARLRLATTLTATDAPMPTLPPAVGLVGSTATSLTEALDGLAAMLEAAERQALIDRTQQQVQLACEPPAATPNHAP